MKFNLGVKVRPSGVFGVPDGEKVIVPSEAGRQINGPAIHARVMRVFGHGTLSEYRKGDAAVRLQLSGNEVALEVRDNYFTMSLDAPDHRAAYALGKPILDRLMRLLTLDFGMAFSYEGQFIDTDGEEAHPWPEWVTVPAFRGTMYNLDEMRQRLITAFGEATVTDKMLNRAMSYFESALVLRDVAEDVSVEAQADTLQGLAYLQLWKSITAVLGEPGTDRDYQRRASDLGLGSGYWKDRVQPLYRIRNDEDVAHYSLEGRNKEAVARAFSQAVGICQEVVRAYRLRLRQEREGEG